MNAGSGAPTEARIYDVRYQRYQGALRSRASSVWAFIRSGWLRAFGIRRSAGAKVWPFFLVACVYLPVVILATVAAVARDALDNKAPTDFWSYGTYLGSTSLVVIVLVASVVPSLLTKDRRDRVLSLYFSTALGRVEYVLGRISSAFLVSFFVTFGPLFLLFLASIFVNQHPTHYLSDHIGDVPKFLLATIVISLYEALVALTVGSLTARRTLAVGAYLVILLVSAALSGGLATATGHDSWNVANLATLPYDVANAVLHEDVDLPTSTAIIGYCVAVGGCLIILAARHGKRATA